jgi:hypothetical protein
VEVTIKRIAVGGLVGAAAVWGVFSWSLVGAFAAHLLTNG